MEKLVLIDGHSILNRAFYGVPDLTNSEGLHTNAVYGFLNIMFKILDEEKADHLAVAFDLKEPTFRHVMFEAYKGTRKPMPQELHEQVPLMKEVLTAMNVPILSKPGFEADDILGTIAKRCQADGVEVSVISGDRDLLQLSDQHIKIRIPKTSRGTTEIHDYYPEDVKREYQVTPIEFIDVKALMGDASDNIPGVPSIGEKTATALITAYGSIENAREHIQEIKPPRAQKALTEHYDMAELSKKLATICIDCDIEFTLEDARIGNLYTDQAYEYMKRLEFKSILARFGTKAQEQVETSDELLLIRDKKSAGAWLKNAKNRLLTGTAEKPADLSFLFLTSEEALPEQSQLSFSFSSDGEAVVGDKVKSSNTKIAGLVLCDGTERVCLVSGGELEDAWIKAQWESLTEGFAVSEEAGAMELAPVRFWTIQLKKQLPLFHADYRFPLFDAGVAAYLLNPLKDTYDYDDLARDYLSRTLPGRADLLGKEGLELAFQNGKKEAERCAAYFSSSVWEAAPVLSERLNRTGMWKLFTDIEQPLIFSLFHMEQAGVRVERKALAEYGNRLKTQITELEAQIFELCGQTFNINSPKQLGEILFEKMGLKGGKKTKTGYSTAADVLEKLAPENPVIRKILEYRQLTKLNSTYAEGLAAFIGPDQRIHGTFNQTITATGRISSTEPNLQNIPIRMELGREIRKVFVPESGFVFVDADYSQIELRILASLSGDERLIGAYASAQDIHALTASQVFHVPLAEVTPLLRRNAKAVNFGIVYGISAFGLSEDLSISRKEANAYISQYFETYPGIKEYLDRLVAEGKGQGYVATLYGRRRPIPELKSSNFMQRSFGERIAMNSPIQGTAADIMKIAMISVDQELRRQNLKSRIVLQVHDELLVETWEPELAKVKAILEDKMKHAANLAVSLEVEAKTGASWFDAK